MAACRSAQFFAYPAVYPRRGLSLAAYPSYQAGESSALLLRDGGLAGRGPIDILLGRLNGPMGATMAVVIAACALYLIYRRTASYRIMGGFLLSSAVIAAIFPRGGLSPIRFGALGALLRLAALLRGFCRYRAGDDSLSPHPAMDLWGAGRRFDHAAAARRRAGAGGAMRDRVMLAVISPARPYPVPNAP